MTVHLLALPNAQTTGAYDLDGFNTMTIRFAKVLERLNMPTILYASEENDAPCQELVTCVTKAEQAQHIGTGQYQHARIEPDNPLWRLASPRMIAEIGKRKQPRDIICLIGGGSQADVTLAHPELMAVEYAIGYVGNYAPYRVFQSQAWRHGCYGAQQALNDGRFFDAVIPGFFEAEKFPELPVEEYLCYVGRFVPKKGVSIACDAARLAGVPLKLIGHGDPSIITYGENLGAVDTATRNDVMARAKALICPTVYVEPYGCISPEAQLCGTPVISTDYGGFTETVEHGKSGFRCNLLGEFVDAIHRVGELDRGYIRQRAQTLYSLDAAVSQYREFFRRLETLWTDGWVSHPYALA